MKPAYHSILVALTSGTLVLSFLAISFRVWIKPKYAAGEAIWRSMDVVALTCAMFGTVMLLLATGSGFMLRPMDALLSSPITKNKMLCTLLTLVCWTSWLVLRLKAGPRLYEARGLVRHYAYVMALAGVLFLMTTNSIGGDLMGNPSGFEQMAQAVGFRTRFSLYFPTALNVLLLAIGFVAIALALWQRRSGRPKS